MNSIEFHEKLNFYSQADDPQDLAIRIFGAPQQNIVADNAVAVKVFKTVEQFLSDHAKQISLYDLPALCELQHTVERLSVWTKGALEKEDHEYLRTLEKTLAASIKLTQNNADLAINPDSEISLEDILSVADEYHSFPDLIKLCIVGKDVLPDALKNAIATARELDFTDFVNEVTRRREFDPHIFKEMIRLFFKHAIPTKHAYFFSFVKIENLLTDIISAMPKDITHLDLNRCPCPRDEHVDNIVRRLNNLKSLHLRNCSFLTDVAITTIALSPNMANLQELHFDLSPLLSDAAALVIAESPCMANLRILSFSGCRNITDVAFRAIATSPHMAKLQSLNFSNSHGSNAGIRALTTSPFMSNMKKLYFTACAEITDVDVIAISNSTYMKNLQILNLKGCTFLTDEAILSIAGSANMSNLEELNLYACNELTDEAARAFSESSNLKNLRTLNLSYCTRLTDIAAVELVESPLLPNLLNLNLCGCELITPEALERVTKITRERLAARE
ncbi:MAG: hypothetical protein H0X29_07810 [Parachlamydiaceae bacterium]|nr:hypothetical protein [Parachlamydiaceae bacterium]